MCTCICSKWWEKLILNQHECVYLCWFSHGFPFTILQLNKIKLISTNSFHAAIFWDSWDLAPSSINVHMPLNQQCSHESLPDHQHQGLIICERTQKHNLYRHIYLPTPQVCITAAMMQHTLILCKIYTI